MWCRAYLVPNHLEYAAAAAAVGDAVAADRHGRIKARLCELVEKRCGNVGHVELHRVFVLCVADNQPSLPNRQKKKKRVSWCL